MHDGLVRAFFVATFLVVRLGEVDSPFLGNVLAPVETRIARVGKFRSKIIERKATTERWDVPPSSQCIAEKVD